MKNIVKSIFRTIFKRKLQTGVLVVFLLVAGLVFTYISTSISAIENSKMSLEANSNPEQFRFMLSKSFSDDDIAQMIEDYDIDQNDFSKSIEDLIEIYHIDITKYFEKDLESLESLYNFSSEPVRKKFVQQKINGDSVNLYVTLLHTNINIPTFVIGSIPIDSGEIAVSKLFAEKNNLTEGSIFAINGKEYTISGIYVAPDQINIYDTTKSVNISTGSNAGILMLKSDFDALNEKDDIYYVGVFNDKSDSEAREAIVNMSKEENVLFAQMSSQYQEISVLTTLVNSNSSLMTLGLLFLYIMLGFAIIIQFSNQFKYYKKPIGVLLAMGISKLKIALSYSVYSVVFGLATVIGMTLGYFLSDSFIVSLSDMYNIVITKPSANWPMFIKFAVITTLALTFFVIAIAYCETKKRPLDLIKTMDKQKIGIVGKLVKKMVSFLSFGTRVKISMAVRKSGRLISMLFTFFIAFNLLGTGLAINNSTANINTEYKNYINFDHVDYYDELMLDKPTSYNNTDIFIDETAKLTKNKTTGKDINYTVTLEGLSSKQTSLNLSSDSLSEGVLISLTTATKHDISVNDKLQFIIDGKYYEYKVIGINPVSLDDKIYIDISNLYELDKFESGTFNGAYVRDDTHSDEAVYSIKSEDLVKISSAFNQSTASISAFLFILAIVISVALIILVTTFNLNDGLINVAIFKFFGYSNRKANNILINVFDPIAICGCILGIFTLPYLLSLFESILLSSSQYYIPFKANITDMVLTAFVLIIIYQVSKVIFNAISQKRTVASILKSE